MSTRLESSAFVLIFRVKAQKCSLCFLCFRCRFKDLEDESKELKEKLAEVEGLLKQAEAQRQDLERQNLIANHALSDALLRACKVTS
jgi:hypothetical protein